MIVVGVVECYYCGFVGVGVCDFDGVFDCFGVGIE